MLLFIFWSLLLTAVLVIYYRQTYLKFKRRGVKYITPFPLLGNMSCMLFRNEHFTQYLKRLYDKFPTERFVGHFEFTSALVFIRDLELVKQICVKDFEHFLDHRTLGDLKVDPFWGRTLFSLKGKEWKDMRSTLSPAFTSSKIRLMVPFMTDVGDHMVRCIKNKIDETGSNFAYVDSKELTARYSNDVIASCAFGLKVNSHVEPENTFFSMGKEASTFKLKQIFVFFASNSFPKLVSWLNLGIFSEKSRNFFKSLISKTMREREEKNIVRPDLIHLLMEAKKGQLSHDTKTKDSDVGFATVEESAVGKQKVETSEWSENDLIAQALIFILGGLETISTVMTFALHELATHPESQKKLVKEILEYNEKNNGKLDLKTLQEMTYMDMVVSEVLRLWTPGFMGERLCSKDYNLGKPNENSKEDYIIRQGQSVILPIWAFHRNPEYFPNPDEFIPERFSEENRHNFPSAAFMPFGTGPRNCIGSRFALCEMKAIIYQLLLHIELFPSEQTTSPIELDVRSFTPKAKRGHVLGFRVRQ